MAEHPDMARETANEITGKTGKKRTIGWKREKFSDMDQLKMAMIDEVFSTLLQDTQEKRRLLTSVRSGKSAREDGVKPKYSFGELLYRNDVPAEAAADILERLTNEQLKM